CAWHPWWKRSAVAAPVIGLPTGSPWDGLGAGAAWIETIKPLAGPNCFSSSRCAGVSHSASARRPLPPIPNLPTRRIGRGPKLLPGLLRETAPHRSSRGRSSPPEAAVALPRAPSRTGTVWLLYPFGPSPLQGPQIGRAHV